MTVAVIIPVYRGLAEVRRCIESVLGHAAALRTASEVVLVDDASPEPGIRDELDSWATADTPVPVTVLHNDENSGFPAAVNRGLHASTDDVVILNADTVVTTGWLDRLAATARSRPDVATVTPLTNFGSICTLPRAIIDAFDLEGADPRIDECAAFVTDHSIELRPEVISGVGFCLYVTRTALDRCGELDAATFGSGYGEEVDFCLRASRLGMYHLVDDRTFVYHRGAVSFGDRRADGLTRSRTIIHERYPFFRAANREERRRDPLRVPFAALELALEEDRPSRPHVLHLLHAPSRIGGTEKHLDALMEALLDEFDFSVLHPTTSDSFILRHIWRSPDGERGERELHLPGPPATSGRAHDEVAAAALETALAMFDYDAVHIHNLIGHSLAPLALLADFRGQVVCSVRDLYVACPNHSLLYFGHTACGIPDDLSYCERCLPATMELQLDSLKEFRNAVVEHLDTVDRWVFASQSAADYMGRVYDLPDARVEIIEHGALLDASTRRELSEEDVLEGPLRLGFAGLGKAKKGYDIVNWLARASAETGVEIHHFGEAQAPADPALILHGTYDNRCLPALLDAAGIHVVLLPAPYAETFGHVMTEALIAGRPVLGTAYGALGERIRRHGCGWTVDPDDRRSILRLIECLDRCRPEILRAARRASATPTTPVRDSAFRYAALYRRPPSVGPTPSESEVAR